MPLSNLYSNRLDHPINNSDGEDVIWQSIKNAISLEAQSVKSEVRIANNSELE